MTENSGSRNKMSTLLGILLIPLLLAGCWDIRYLDEISIVMAIGLDKGDNRDILVTVQVVNPNEVSTGGGKTGGSASPVTTYSESGKTVFEAIRKIANKTSRKLYFSHNQVLVIGEEAARQGVGSLFEFIERDPEVRTDFYVVTAKGSRASDILNVTTPIEKIPSTEIHEAVENVEKNLGTSFGVTVKDLIQSIDSQRFEIATGSIRIVGEPRSGNSNKDVENVHPQAMLSLNGMAVFKNEKLIDFFKPGESRGMAWIRDKINNTVINVPCKQAGYVAIEIVHTSTSLKAEVLQGQPKVRIHVDQEANVGENLCPAIDVTDMNTLKHLEIETDEQTKNEILAAVEKAQKMKTDLFGFADAVYKRDPAYWKQHKNNWDRIFPEIRVQIDVNTEINKEGARNKSYYRKVRMD